MTRLSCKVTKAKAEQFKAICKEKGTNTNAVLLAYINKFIEVYDAQEKS